MRASLLGGVLLIVGTSIGAGMLGLPIAAAELGFAGSLILLFVCWALMIVSAFLILEVNMWLPQHSNLISMARETIGPVGQVIAWVTYLLLLYSLLCAYIAGGSDLFYNLLVTLHLHVPRALSALLFTCIFGFVVYLGIHSVDRANRVLMILKFGALFSLIFLLIPSVSLEKLSEGHLYRIGSTAAIMVTIASFCWATLIPSLRIYFAGDIKKLKKAVMIGSTIPLICYIVWDAVIMGVIPLSGEHSLTAVLHSNNSTSGLVSTLSTTVHQSSVTFFVKFFTSICVLTSFLGVALCLTDFFSDGLQIDKKGRGGVIIYALTFLPALAVAVFIPNVFIKALEYAGIYCMLLLIFLPAWMTWCGRYVRKIPSVWTVWGGKPLLAILIVASLILIARVVLHA